MERLKYYVIYIRSQELKRQGGLLLRMRAVQNSYWAETAINFGLREAVEGYACNK